MKAHFSSLLAILGLAGVCVLAAVPSENDRPLTERDRIAGQVIFNTSKMKSDPGAVGEARVRRYLEALEDDQSRTLSFDEATEEQAGGGEKVRILWDVRITFLNPAQVARADNDALSEREKKLHQGQDPESEAQIFYEENPRARVPTGRVYFRLIRDDVVVEMRINRPLQEGVAPAVASARQRWHFCFREAERLGLFLPRDDYPSWFVRMKRWQGELAEATAKTWEMISHLAAATQAEKIRAEKLLQLARSIEGREDDAAQRIHRSLLAKAREANQRILDNGKLKQDLIQLTDEGWKGLEEELTRRQEKERDSEERREEIDPWLKRIKQDRVGNRLELSMMAGQDQASRDRLLRNIEEAAQKATDEGELLRYLNARVSLGAHREALHAAREFVKKFPTSGEGQEVLKKLEIHFLNQIVLKIRQEKKEVDRLLGEWGGGQIDPATGQWRSSGVVTVFNQETGEWQWPELHIPWMRWMGIITGETYRLWESGETEKAKAAEQIVGIYLLIHMRHQGVRLDEIPLTGEAILQTLSPGDLPKKKEQLTPRENRVEKAVFAALVNPDVDLLVKNQTPLIELRTSYLRLSTFQSPEWDTADSAIGELLFNQVVAPGMLGFGGRLVMKIPLAQDALKIFVDRGVGKLLIGKPAELMARYKQGIANLPGYSGAVATAADMIGRPYAVGLLAQKAGELAQHWDNDGYASMAVSLVITGWASAIDARATQLVFQKRYNTAVEMTRKADQRRTDWEEAGRINDTLHQKAKEIRTNLSSPDPAVVQKAQAEAKKMFHKLRKEIEEEQAAFAGTRRGQSIPTSFDEKQRLKAAFGQMAKPGASGEQLRREMTAAEGLQRVRVIETNAAQRHATLMEQMMGLKPRPQPAARILSDYPRKPADRPAPMAQKNVGARDLTGEAASVDNNTLVKAFNGNETARNLLRGKGKFITPEVYDEFINPANVTRLREDVTRFKRLRWLKESGLDVKPAVVDRDIYNRVRAELGDHGASDLRQIAMALERGHRLITNEGRYVRILMDKINQGKLPPVEVVQMMPDGSLVLHHRP